MLYSDMYWLTLLTFYCFVFVSHVEVRFDISPIKESIDWLGWRFVVVCSKRLSAEKFITECVDNDDFPGKHLCNLDT